MSTESAKQRDYFTDHSLLVDPYAWLDEIRAGGPVQKLEGRDVIMVTGFEEAAAILLDTEHFSSAIAAAGPTAPLPFEPQGSDITAQIAEHHHKFVGAEQFISYDGVRHTQSRSLLTGLFVPSRLRAVESYMTDLAERMVQEAVAQRECEIINTVATPYVTLVIADLLGVPHADHPVLREAVTSGPPPGSVDDDEGGASLVYLARKVGALFYGYIQERRASPQEDVLTTLATATCPDGRTPEIDELVMLAIFLFAAGQDTSAKLLGNSLRYLAENPSMQELLRQDRSQIASFIEEMLRLEGSSKVAFRLARKDVVVAGQRYPAGTKFVCSLAGANRDPRRWQDPNAFVLNRPKIKEHLAFSRGAHTCIGAPLARAEVRILLDRLLEHTTSITLSEAQHGPPGERRFAYEPSYIIRGLERLYLRFEPAVR